MKPKKPKVDPEIQKQRDIAAKEKQNVIQDRVGRETDDLLRLFGRRNALSGAGMRIPLIGGN